MTVYNQRKLMNDVTNDVNNVDEILFILGSENSIMETGLEVQFKNSLVFKYRITVTKKKILLWFKLDAIAAFSLFSLNGHTGALSNATRVVNLYVLVYAFYDIIIFGRKKQNRRFQNYCLFCSYNSTTYS